MSEAQWCEIQARIIIAARGWRPYYEPLSALALPENLYAPIGNSPRWIYCQPTRSRIVDRIERAMCAALDSAESLTRLDVETKAALGCLSASELELVVTLVAYSGSNCQFDFEATAHAWVTARRGRMPAPTCTHRHCTRGTCLEYSAWVNSKARKLAVYASAWRKSCCKLRAVLVAPG